MYYHTKQRAHDPNQVFLKRGSDIRILKCEINGPPFRRPCRRPRPHYQCPLGGYLYHTRSCRACCGLSSQLSGTCASSRQLSCILSTPQTSGCWARFRCIPRKDRRGPHPPRPPRLLKMLSVMGINIYIIYIYTCINFISV